MNDLWLWQNPMLPLLSLFLGCVSPEPAEKEPSVMQMPLPPVTMDFVLDQYLFDVTDIIQSDQFADEEDSFVYDEAVAFNERVKEMYERFSCQEVDGEGLLGCGPELEAVAERTECIEVIRYGDADDSVTPGERFSLVFYVNKAMAMKGIGEDGTTEMADPYSLMLFALSNPEYYREVGVADNIDTHSEYVGHIFTEPQEVSFSRADDYFCYQDTGELSSDAASSSTVSLTEEIAEWAGLVDNSYGAFVGGMSGLFASAEQYDEAGRGTIILCR